MSYLRTLYNHYEIFRKIKFQWERIFENPWPFASSPSIFNLKTVLSSQKIGEGHTFIFPIVSLLPLLKLSTPIHPIHLFLINAKTQHHSVTSQNTPYNFVKSKYIFPFRTEFPSPVIIVAFFLHKRIFRN